MTQQNIQHILNSIHAAGGRALLVGGAVRDEVLGHQPKDLDIEVYGLDVTVLEQVLTRFGAVQSVGRSFGVLKLRLADGTDLDISLPRRDSKMGVGHQAFQVESDPSLSPRAAAARRDFTMNAMARDLHTGDLLDFFGGQADLRAGILRHTSPAFAEDPLRVLRGMQFAGRFDLCLVSETADLCRDLLVEAGTLAQERIWDEWEKLLLKGVRPSAGLRVLVESGWIVLFPELQALIGCEQDAEHHPEGDAWQHTMHVVDAAAAIAERDGLTGDDRLVLVLAALCHDLGKATTTVVDTDGRIRSHGHAGAGEAPTRSLLTRIGAPARLVERVVPLVVEHMAHLGLPMIARSVRRLAVRLTPSTVEAWARVVEADHSGRPPLPAGNPAAPFVALAETEGAQAGRPEPILMGRHLLELGFAPGPSMGTLLRQAYDAQMDGVFSTLDEALAWAQK